MTSVSPRTACSQSPNSSAFDTVARERHESHRLGEVDDDLLPHRPAEAVGEVVHLVHDHVRESVEQRRVGVEHVAQHLGRHHDDACTRVHVRVAREQADCVGAPDVDELLVLLVRQRLDRRRVEDLRIGLLHREEHRELGDDRLAGTGRRGHEHTAAFVERRAGCALEGVEVEAEPSRELGEPRLPALLAGKCVTLGRREAHHPSSLDSVSELEAVAALDTLIVQVRDEPGARSTARSSGSRA